MAAELTDEQKRILYPDWETRYILPRPRGEDLKKGDVVGAEVFHNGEWVRLVDPVRKPRGRG